nr:hypothetical protein [Tanacetum cinerariifolium]
MRFAKKVRGTVKASESLRGKLVKTMRKETLCFRTSCIYQGKEDQSFSIRSLSESKMACTKQGMGMCRLAQTLVTSAIDQRLDGVLVVELVDGEQFIEEIIEEGNLWPNIKIVEVRMKASKFEEGCFNEIQGNAKEYHIRGMELEVVVLN